MKHTVVAWMEDRPGVLTRVTSLFRRRGFNIESLAVGHSETPGISRMTFVVDGDERMVDQAVKQLEKQIDVTRVEDVTDQPVVVRELALIRVRTDSQTRAEIMQIVEVYRAQIVDMALDSLIIQVVGAEERIDSLIDLLSHYGIREMVRTGRVAITRGRATLHQPRPTATAQAQWQEQWESGRWALVNGDWIRTREPLPTHTNHQSPISSQKRTYGNTILRKRCRSEPACGPQGRCDRLWQPGPCPCAEPEGQRHGRAGGPLSQLAELGQGPGGRAGGQDGRPGRGRG